METTIETKVPASKAFGPKCHNLEGFARSTGMNSDKVLILEDDMNFAGIVTQYFRSWGFAVNHVQDGVEGIKHIISEEYGVILCDMLMPNLPGDMFYLAVERMRPHLCDRFIFITGLQGNAKVAEFLKKVDGTLLPKPFQVDDLLDLVGFIQVKIGLC